MGMLIDPFRFVVVVPKPTLTLEIKMATPGVFSLNAGVPPDYIDWGDGTPEDFSRTGVHTYTAAGNYFIKLGPTLHALLPASSHYIVGVGPTENGVKVPVDFKVEKALELLYVKKFDCAGLIRFMANGPKLNSLELLNTSSLVDMEYSFIDSPALITFPLIDTSNVYSANMAFLSSGLTSFPALDLRKVTALYMTWSGCNQLVTMGAVRFDNCASFYRTWTGCLKLVNFPANVFDLSPCADYSDLFGNGTGDAAPLSAASIENVLISLVTAGRSGGRFRVWGAGESTWSAAAKAAKASLIAKGWTVTNNP